MSRLTGNEYTLPENPSRDESLEFFLCEGPHERHKLVALDEEVKTTQMNMLIRKMISTTAPKQDLIDTRSIDKSKGDITKVPDYYNVEDALNAMTNLTRRQAQVLMELSMLKGKMREYTSDFQKAYRENNLLAIWLYQSMVMSLFYGTVLAISTSVRTQLDQSGMTIAYMEDRGLMANYVIQDIHHYNQAFRSGKIAEFIKTGKKGKKALFGDGTDPMMVEPIKVAPIKLRGIGEEVDDEENQKSVNEDFGTILGVTVAAIAAFFFVIYLVRKSIIFFYNLRRHFSREFMIVSQFLEINAATKKSGGVKQKQIKLAKQMAKLSDNISVKNDIAEKTSKDTVRREVNTEHVPKDSVPASAGGSPLI